MRLQAGQQIEPYLPGCRVSRIVEVHMQLAFWRSC